MPLDLVLVCAMALPYALGHLTGSLIGRIGPGEECPNAIRSISYRLTVCFIASDLFFSSLLIIALQGNGWMLWPCLAVYAYVAMLRYRAVWSWHRQRVD